MNKIETALILLVVSSTQVEAFECEGTLLLPSVCLPSSYSKESPPSAPPVKASGKFGSLEILGLNLKEQTMTLAIEVGLGWLDERFVVDHGFCNFYIRLFVGY